VELSEVFVEGLVHLSTLSDDLYSFDEKNHALIGRRSGRTLRIGDPARVRVVAVNPQARRIEFVLEHHNPVRRDVSVPQPETEEYPRIPVRGKRPVFKGRR
jgi:ribonuclease R